MISDLIEAARLILGTITANMDPDDPRRPAVVKAYRAMSLPEAHRDEEATT